jgi:hypothetical protein
MPPSLNIEVLVAEPDHWQLIGRIVLGNPDGSISDNHDGGRDIYLFGVDPIENQGYVKRSKVGIDRVTEKTRAISSLGFTTVAALNDGESHTITVKTDKSPESGLRITKTNSLPGQLLG